MPITRLVVCASLAAAAAGGAAVALPAAGQDPAPPAAETITLLSVQAPREERGIDLPPRGPSVGDRWVFASSLLRAEHFAGRMEGDCIWQDRRYQGLNCTLTAVLADGTITMHGIRFNHAIPGVGQPDQAAIAGGTGAYAGARGTMKRTGNGRRDTLVLQILP